MLTRLYNLRRLLSRFRLAAMGVAVSCMALGSGLADEPAARTDLYGDPIPAGAMTRLGTERFRGAGHPIFARDDETLITFTGDRIVLFEAATGRRLQQFSTGEQQITSARPAPDGKTIVTCGSEFNEARAENLQTVKRWNLASGELLSKASFADRFGANSFEITPDGGTAIVAGGDGTLHFLDLTSGDEVLNYKIDNRRIDALAISPDGKMIVAAGSNALYFWEWQAGNEPVKIALGRRVVSLAFSPDGSLLAEGPDSRGELALRDVRSREVRRTLAAPEGKPLYVSGLAFSGDGQTLVAANAIGIRGLKHRIHFWDVATGASGRQLSTGEMQPYRLALSRDGRWVAAIGSGSALRVWDLKSERLMGEEMAGHESSINSIHLPADGRTAVTAGDDGTIRVWDADTGRQRQLLQHGYWVRATAVSPDGRLIASSSLDNTVRLWEAATGREIYRLPGHGELGGKRAVAFTADGRSFASWGDDFYLRVWDVRTGKALSERRVSTPNINLPETEDDGDRTSAMERFLSIDQAVFSRSARWLALHSGNSMAIFDVDSGNEVAHPEHKGGHLAALAFSPDAARIATSAWGRSVAIPLADGRTRYTSEKNHSARVLEIASGKELFEVPLPDRSAGPMAFSADGKSLALVSNAPSGTTLLVLDAATGKQSASMANLPDRADALCFSADGKRLACGFGNGTALVWNLSLTEKTP